MCGLQEEQQGNTLLLCHGTPWRDLAKTGTEEATSDAYSWRGKQYADPNQEISMWGHTPTKEAKAKPIGASDEQHWEALLWWRRQCTDRRHGRLHF